MDDEEEASTMLQGLLDSMKSMSREELRAWFNENMDNDEDVVKVFDEMFSKEDWDNDELIEFLRQTLTGDQDEVHQPQADAVTSPKVSADKPSTKLASVTKQIEIKKEGSHSSSLKTTSSSSGSSTHSSTSTSSASSNRKTFAPKVKKRKLSSTDESAASDATVEVGTGKRRKTEKAKKDAKPTLEPKKRPNDTKVSERKSKVIISNASDSSSTASVQRNRKDCDNIQKQYNQKVNEKSYSSSDKLKIKNADKKWDRKDTTYKDSAITNKSSKFDSHKSAKSRKEKENSSKHWPVDTHAPREKEKDKSESHNDKEREKNRKHYRDQSDKKDKRDIDKTKDSKRLESKDHRQDHYKRDKNDKEKLEKHEKEKNMANKERPKSVAEKSLDKHYREINLFENFDKERQDRDKERVREVKREKLEAHKEKSDHPDAAKYTEKVASDVVDEHLFVKSEKVEAVDLLKTSGTPENSVPYGPTVAKAGGHIYVDQDYPRYRHKFNLKPVTVTLYDIRRQSVSMVEGDRVYRRKLAEERKRKKLERKLEEKKEKYSERGTRILPFEKRPENSEYYRKKGEIVREKPKLETPTEKQKRLLELHRKERDKEKEKKINKINSEFKIPKQGSRPIIQENLIGTTFTSSTPLAPAANVQKLQFDKKRLVSAKETDTWKLTPEEERALKGEKDNPVCDIDEIVLDDGFQLDHEVDAEGEKVEGTVDLEKEEEDDAASYAFPNTPPPPLEDVEVNDMSIQLLKLMDREETIAIPDDKENHADVIIRKCAKWWRANEAEPYYQPCPSIPEQEEENFYTIMKCQELDDDEESFFGNVSNPDGQDYDLQDNEITSTNRDPDVVDEYCGAGLLNCKYRVKLHPEGPELTADCFKSIFEVRRGCNYDKHNFQARCMLCSELITSKRHLGAHVRSSSHRTSLTKTSLTLIGVEPMLASESNKAGGKSPADSSPIPSKNIAVINPKRGEKLKDVDDINGKSSSRDKISRHGSTDATKPRSISSNSRQVSDSKPRTNSSSRHRRRSRSRSQGRRHRRSRSRSHGRRSRSRSPARRQRRSRSRSSPRGGRHNRHSRSRSPGRSHRRSSKERVEEFLARNERATRRNSPPKPVGQGNLKLKPDDDGDIFREKLSLQAKGKWSAQLEAKWKLKDDEEERWKKLFQQKKKLLEEKPEDHPTYADEWTKFWETRYNELTVQGRDADSYDYTEEWKIHWGKLSAAFLEEEYNNGLCDIRKKYGMDLETLKQLSAGSTTVTVPQISPAITTVFNTGPAFVSGPHAGIGATPGFAPVIPPVASFIPTHTLAPNIVPFVPEVPHFPHPLLGVPPPGLGNTAPPLTNDNPGSAGVDCTPRSMSLSNASGVTPCSDQVTSKAPAASQQKVTVDDIKSTWLNLTGQKIQQAVVEAAKSIASNSSSKSKDYDYDGLDVIHVLRLMTGLEDELSFFTVRVLEYYKQAEQLELEEPKKSFSLLNDKEFVTLLFQSRDKLFAMLRANVSPKDVMKKLNLTVFAMNALLDSPKCQKFKPPTPSPVQETLCTSASNMPGEKEVSLRRFESKSVLPMKFGNSIAAALTDLPAAKKSEMSLVIAHSLIAQGKDRFNEDELMSTLVQIMSPILASSGQISPGRSGNVRRCDVGKAASDESIVSSSSLKNGSRSENPFRMSETKARSSSPLSDRQLNPSFPLSSFIPGAFMGSDAGSGDHVGKPFPSGQVMI